MRQNRVWCDAGAAGLRGIVLSTRLSASGPGCQHGVDTKAFKGKAACAREVEQQHEQVVAAMVDLAKSTKLVQVKWFFLEVHRRAQTGQTSLRWRMRYGRWRHVQWEDKELQAVLKQMSPDWRDFYAEVNRRAVELNQKDQRLRQELRSEKLGTGGVDESTDSAKR